MSHREAGRRFPWLAGLIVLALALALPRIWRFLLAALLLADTIGATQTPLLSRVGAEPRRIGTTVQGSAESSPADLYLPASGSPRRFLLLIHGVNETGKDDARIVALASNLARLESAVFVPDFPNLRRLRVGPSDVEAVVLAYRDLLERYPGQCGEGEANACGLLSFSYGVGPALIAAADPRVRERIGFVVAFGGYAELTEVVRFVTTEQASDPRVEARPFPWAKWVFLTANAALVDNADDRRLLEEMARARVDDPGADVSAFQRELGPEGRALWSLMTNRDPARTEALLRSVHPGIQAAIAALSPLSRVASIRARLILAHGMGDRSIPFTESERLAAAAPGRASLTLTRLFSHVDPSAPSRREDTGRVGALADILRMIRFADEILSHST